ncbi:MAG: hypothetical protein EOM80_09665 [Erysipelotrichia bacterium]|nr:hypothetical protein [Erysipelotrichia bacterium]
MYASDLSLQKQTSLSYIPQPAQNLSRNDSFSGSLAAVLQSEEQEESSQAIALTETTRTLSSVDASVQKAIQEAFGIEPYKPGDKLDIAPMAMWQFQSKKTGTITNADMESNVAKAEEIFKDHLSRFIINEDIATKPPIELTYSGDGSVKVQDDHPDKARIEQFINGNPQLRNLYAGINSTKNFIAIAEESIKFQKRYAVDPKAAVAEFSHLFSGNYSYKTGLTISGDSWNYQTNSVWSFKS